MSVSEKIKELHRSLPEGVTLVAVSKTHSAEAVMEAYNAGQRIFGESRPQELAAKAAGLPPDIEWHMIGHLQTNKVKMVAPVVALIHSVDSPRLLEVIEKEAAKAGRTIDVLFEIHIALEENKHGWTEDELTGYLRSGAHLGFRNIRFRGLMSIASNTDDMQLVAAEFESLHTLYKKLKSEFFPTSFDTLSMGMTSDYTVALAHGSNMVRIGSLIFGDRQTAI